MSRGKFLCCDEMGSGKHIGQWTADRQVDSRQLTGMQLVCSVTIVWHQLVSSGENPDKTIS
jgi:hypothetical protein